MLAAAEPAAAGTLRKPIDPAQQTMLAFGDRSHWLQPWRGYLDTVQADALLGAVGINFNVSPSRAQATARLLGESGFRRARVEVPWGSLDYNRRDRIANDDALRVRLEALRSHGIRPLILLNSHHGAPVPLHPFDVQLVARAGRGATSVRVDPATAAAIVPGRTGLDSADGSKAADILFTGVASDGTATLSKPLPDALEPGRYEASTLAYAPFERPRLAGGGRNPAFEQTIAGWLDYVAVVTRRVREILGGTRFDVEIWNELGFGSDFLDASRYYSQLPRNATGDTERELLERTVAFLRDRARSLKGVGIVNGFASQRPWEAGSTSPRGLTAIAKHPYKSMLRLPGGKLNPNQRPLDAIGKLNGLLAGTGIWNERFVPTYNAFFPEYFLSAIQTEHLVRDLSPITTTIGGTEHGRNTHPSGSPPPGLWITETGMDFTAAEPTEPADPAGDPLRGLSAATVSRLRAKATLRAATAFVNKGVDAIYFFAARDATYGLIDEAFYTQVDRLGGRYPGAASAGPAIAAIGNMTEHFGGSRGTIKPRRLALNRITENHNRVQFAGDSSTGRPPLYDREVLAFLPFQVANGRFIASVYVMTRDLARVRRPGLPHTNPARFDLRPALYRLEISNLNGRKVAASAYDPLADQKVRVRVVSRSRRSAVIALPVTDSPRLVTLDDSTASRSRRARVRSVRRRGARLYVSGSAVAAARVKLAVRFRARGNAHVRHRTARVSSGRFKARFKLPRSLRRSGRTRFRVVAQVGGDKIKSSWRA